MWCRELTGYKFGTLEIEKIKVDLPNGKQDSLSNAYRWLTLKGGVLTIRKGYAWNGSSVPLKQWTSWLWDSDKYCKKASLIHDALCQLMREGILSKIHKEYADTLYREMCIEGGMGEKEADIRFWCLRRFPNKGIRKKDSIGRKTFKV